MGIESIYHQSAVAAPKVILRKERKKRNTSPETPERNEMEKRAKRTLLHTESEQEIKCNGLHAVEYGGPHGKCLLNAVQIVFVFVSAFLFFHNSVAGQDI